MRTSTIIVLLLLFLTPSMLMADPLEGSISELAGKDWTIIRDASTVTLVRQKIRVMSTLGFPGFLDDDELWKNSMETDFRITITFGPKLSDEQYQAFKNLREQFILERRKTRNPGSKNSYTEQIDADAFFRLPQYYKEGLSVTVYSSWEYHYLYQLDDIQKTLDKIHALIQKSFKKYDQPEK